MTSGVRRFVECYVDGGVLGRNPSPRGVYWSLLVDGIPTTAVVRKRAANFHTNNDAEWLAVREALLWVTANAPNLPVVIYSDSRHVVDCYNQRKRIKVERLLRLYYECRRLDQKLPFVAVKWVPRETSLKKVGH
jgi:ribonuclease HI